MSPDNGEILTVSQINAQVRWLIEENFPEIRVLGEVSNFKRHSSGHLYMTLKDSSSQLGLVCFRGDAERIDFDIGDGQQVLACGRLTIYEPYGRYQLVAHSVKKAGIGELELAFKALREKLEEEGLFSAEHKKPIPKYACKIAVVTSPTGAAVRDIVTNIRRRWPCAELLLFPVNVQGDQAVGDMLSALELIPAIGDVDLVIIGRGGGSLEDLWAFNDEKLARAIFALDAPVISAVGHETDFTISDFVADVRAATPTMAAEIAVPVKEDVEARVESFLAYLLKHMEEKVRLNSYHLHELLRSYGMGRIKGRLEASLQRLDFAMDKLRASVVGTVESYKNRLDQGMAKLGSLSPRAVLKRGYALCSKVVSREIVSTAQSALEAGEMRVDFYDGGVLAQVKERDNERKKR